PGFAASPYMSGRKPNAPDGVVRSPSRLFAEMPRWPSQAVHGPATARQQPPIFCQSSSVPWVEARYGATTVTSCNADPVDANWFARLPGQAAAFRLPLAAGAAAPSVRQAARAIHLIACRLRADEAPPARTRCAAAALHAFGLARDRRTAAALLAAGLSGCSATAAARAPDVLGLRRAGSHRRARCQRLRGRRRRSRLPPPVRRAVSDPAAAADRRLSRSR